MPDRAPAHRPPRRRRARARAATCRSRARRRASPAPRAPRGAPAPAAPCSAASSRSRPASGVTSAWRERVASSSACTGALSRSSPASASRASRDAALTTSPAGRASRSVTSAVPAVTPRRTSSTSAASHSNSVSRRWSAVAARTARRHSSSWLARLPNTASRPSGSCSTTGSPWRRRTVTAASTPSAHRLLEHLRIQRIAAVAEAHVGRDADHLAPRGQRRPLLRAVEQGDQRRRRREAEVVGELPPGDTRGGERLGPAAAELQRPHELEPQRFAQRVLGDQRGELTQDALVPAEGEVGLDARAETSEAQLVQARDLGRGEGLVAQAVQRRTSPQRHRRMQRVRGGGGIAAGQRGLALTRQAREAIRVDRLGVVELKRVAAPLQGNGGGADCGAQARDDDLQGVGGIGRKALAPERVDGAVRGDRLAAPDEQEPEESQRLTAHGDSPIVEIESLRRAPGCGTARPSPREPTPPACRLWRPRRYGKVSRGTRRRSRGPTVQRHGSMRRDVSSCASPSPGSGNQRMRSNSALSAGSCSAPAGGRALDRPR